MMNESEVQVLRASAFLLTVGIALSLQHLLPHTMLRGNWRVNGPLWLLNGVLLAGTCGACTCSTARWASASGYGILNTVALPVWLDFVVTIAALDFVSYLWHRANHRVAFLWRFHSVHHSDISFTVSTGLRFHPGELLLSLPLRLLAIVLLGPPVAAVVAFEIAFNFVNLFEHGNTALPEHVEKRIAGIFVTPALHRRHHACQRPELDSNFATIFIWWDRLLGTFGNSSSGARISTGLPGLDRNLSIREMLLLPVTTDRGKACR